MSDSTQCTCYQVTTSDGDVRPISWVHLHEQVTLVTRDGQSVDGFSMGAHWRGPEDAWAIRYGVSVWCDDSVDVDVDVDLDDIVTLTPTGGYDDVDSVVAAIGERLNCGNFEEMARMKEPAMFRYVVGDHESLDITITYETHDCMPHQNPPEGEPLIIGLVGRG